MLSMATYPKLHIFIISMRDRIHIKGFFYYRIQSCFGDRKYVFFSSNISCDKNLPHEILLKKKMFFFYPNFYCPQKWQNPVVKPLRIYALASRPSGGGEGDRYFFLWQKFVSKPRRMSLKRRCAACPMGEWTVGNSCLPTHTHSMIIISPPKVWYTCFLLIIWIVGWYNE